MPHLQRPRSGRKFGNSRATGTRPFLSSYLDRPWGKASAADQPTQHVRTLIDRGLSPETAAALSRGL